VIKISGKLGNLITSREPKDIPAFNKAIINLLSNHFKSKKVGGEKIHD